MSVLEMGAHSPMLHLDRLVPPNVRASLVSRKLDVFKLIAFGTETAYLYSLVARFAPGIFPPSFRAMGWKVAIYYEPTVLGQVLELRARDRMGP
jgi:Cu+-exporting ATPase